MKTFFLTSVFTIALFTLVCAQLKEEKYLNTMRRNIDSIYSAKSISAYQTAVNSMQRIGAAEPGKWEPRYYAAFGFIMMSTLTNDATQKDSYLDQAVAEIAKAREAVTNESEIDALEGFAYMMRVTVDPATRGAQMAPLAMKHYQKALALDPGNPRAMALLAQMQYGTAQFFGSPLTEACETAHAAVQKFATYNNDNTLAPRWGKSMAESLAAKCQ